MLYIDLLCTVVILRFIHFLTSAQTCLPSADRENETPLSILNAPYQKSTLPIGSQAIVTSYQFQCCGNVTSWKTRIRLHRATWQEGYYSINFQVWRPSKEVRTDGCYSLVGEDRYENTQLHDNGVIRKKINPSNHLQVQPGDVVGINTKRLNREIKGGILLKEDTEGSMWYRTSMFDDPLPAAEGECPFPVGDRDGRVLSTFVNAVPVLSVDIGKEAITVEDLVEINLNLCELYHCLGFSGLINSQ